MHDISFKGFGREVTINRADGQGLEAQLFGITTSSPDHKFKVLKDVMIISGDLVTPPSGVDTFKWIEETLTPDVLNSDKISKF
jgi:branched-chain amino acid transport system substrate-binding protein